jgi:hypothetical protein
MHTLLLDIVQVCENYILYNETELESLDCSTGYSQKSLLFELLLKTVFASTQNLEKHPFLTNC